MTAGRAVLLGGLVVGGLDALDAIVFFGLRSGARPIRIFQSIGAGLLGRSAFQGGWRTAALGACLHWFIALTIVAVYALASRRLSVLVRHPAVFGPLYGIAAYAVMNLVVLPLSAAGRPAYSWPVVANGLLIHMFGVGLPSALFARMASRR
jgi:hypothetical protein